MKFKLLFSLCVLMLPAQSMGEVTATVNGRERVVATRCEAIRGDVASALGQRSNSARVNCYIYLFHKETSCRHTLSQGQGNAGNAHAAYGLCSIEKSPAVRRANGRGPDCVDISTVRNQAKCCHSMMSRTKGRYFGPVIRGEVPRCDLL